MSRNQSNKTIEYTFGAFFTGLLILFGAKGYLDYKDIATASETCITNPEIQAMYGTQYPTGLPIVLDCNEIRAMEGNELFIQEILTVMGIPNSIEISGELNSR